MLCSSIDEYKTNSSLRRERLCVRTWRRGNICVSGLEILSLCVGPRFSASHILNLTSLFSTLFYSRVRRTRRSTLNVDRLSRVSELVSLVNDLGTRSTAFVILLSMLTHCLIPLDAKPRVAAEKRYRNVPPTPYRRGRKNSE